MQDFCNIEKDYDEELLINGELIVPDFTFEGADCKLFHWEHMGAMDMQDYADRNFRKLKKYHRLGIIPGDNLILSFDRKGAIDMPVIDDIIRHEIIPRL